MSQQLEALRKLKPLAAAAGPEGIAAVELVDQLAKAAPEYYEQAKQVGNEILHAAGLTSDENYEGWLALIILVYYYLAPPVKLLYQIELQTAGVLEQLYTWLGGAGKALENGVHALEAPFQPLVQFGSDVVSFFERWL